MTKDMYKATCVIEKKRAPGINLHTKFHFYNATVIALAFYAITLSHDILCTMAKWCKVSLGCVQKLNRKVGWTGEPGN